MRNGLSVTATDLGDWLSGRQPVTPGGLHYEMMEMSWTTFIGVVTLAFLLLNLNSGSAWARLPDAIAKQPDLTLGASDKLGAVQPVPYWRDVLPPYKRKSTIAPHRGCVESAFTGYRSEDELGPVQAFIASINPGAPRRAMARLRL